MKDISTQFYDKVTDLAVKKGKTLVEISLELGKTPSFISSRKSQGAIPKLNTIIEIARVLDVSPSELLEGILDNE